MVKFLQLCCLTIAISISAVDIAIAAKIDATLSFIIHNPKKNDVKNITKEFSRNFAQVEPFKLTRNVNFYLHYYAIDENFVQYKINTRDNEDFLRGDGKIANATGDFGSEGYEKFKRTQGFNEQFSSGEREIKTTKIVKPFKGYMVLYNSYGTELIRVESKDHYKTESGAIKNTIRQMRRAINDEKDKMAIPQKRRCLFCDYAELKERQRENVGNISFIAHKNLFDQLYGEISQNDLPNGLVPYANLYASLKDYDALEHIFDTDAIIFDNQVGTKKLPGHLINELIKAQAPKKLMDKVSLAYAKNNFQELDLNNHTPLWSAISQKDTALISQLIALGTDVNQVTKIDNSYLTPLIVSAQLGDIQTTNLLLKHGARKNLATINGQTAWSSAMWLAKYDHADLLWPQEFIDPNSDSAKHFLTQAAYFGQRDKVQELLTKGVSISARGISGDNIVISSIKGIKTFAIEEQIKSPNSTAHKINDDVFWGVIEDIENSGSSSSIISAMDTKRQTLLFHAYPDGSQAVTDQHIELFSRIIEKGIDPKTVNIDGQTAEQAYKAERLAYLDTLYERRLEEISEARRMAAKLAQDKQDEAMQLALENISERKSFRAGSRARSQARRLASLDRMDDNARAAGIDSQTTRFERDTSDVDQEYNSDEAKRAVSKQIRDNYAAEIKIANDKAIEDETKLKELIENLKRDAIENSEKRLVQISQIASDG